MPYQSVPASVQEFMDHISQLCVDDGHDAWAKNFQAAYADTLLTTLRDKEDGTTYLLTGDIPAMWLRDSTAQMRPYLPVAKTDDELAGKISGLVKRQFMYINIDPYANAFNEEANGAHYHDDVTQMNPWIWERKYEVDSLCYPVQLAYLLYANTGRTDQFDDNFVSGVRKILDVFTTEQDHTRSPYTFERFGERPVDTLTAGAGLPLLLLG